jgi:hypothetical protein
MKNEHLSSFIRGYRFGVGGRCFFTQESLESKVIMMIIFLFLAISPYHYARRWVVRVKEQGRPCAIVKFYRPVLSIRS